MHRLVESTSAPEERKEYVVTAPRGVSVSELLDGIDEVTILDALDDQTVLVELSADALSALRSKRDDVVVEPNMEYRRLA